MKKLYPLLSVLFLIYWGCEEEQDTTPPTVSISSHSSGQTVYEIITITVTTHDNEGISKVEFFIDNSLVKTDTESPYEYEWNTTQYEDDSEHIVKVISYDNSENSTESQPIMLIIDNSGSLPTPSELYTILYDDGFYISWSQNNDDDFGLYKVYESQNEDMIEPTLIYETANRIDTSYFKSEQNLRYYQIFVEDVSGNQSGSNIEMADYNVEMWGKEYSVVNTTNITFSLIDYDSSIVKDNYDDTLYVSGSIPPQIGQLINLERLQLRQVKFSGSIPSEIGNLTNLQTLDLVINNLTGEIPPEIGNLTNMTRLYLSSNQLSGTIPSELGNLFNLEILCLQRNQLSGLIPDNLCDLNLDWNTSYVFENQLCPPYPSCIEDYVGEQDTSNCP